MPEQSEKPRIEGEDTADLLARRLSEAVHNVGNGNGAVNGGGHNGAARERALRVAGDVGAAILAETSTGTAEHSDDVVLITEAIGQRMDVVGDYAGDLLAAARLHDIGKAWIPGEVLHKAGPLSVEEWELMRQHTVVGEQILGSVEELRDVARLVRHSHERWDGHGYPDGLAGPEIPLGSRIIFCADAFHAIRCDRPYRAGRSAGEALAEIKRNAGTQFDPDVASALERVVHERNRRPLRGGGSARLFALLMCLVLGGAGTAVARSGALGEVSEPASAVTSPPPACGTAACPSVAGPVGGLGAVGSLSGQPGPRPLFPGLPGQLHRAAEGSNGKHLAKGHHEGNGKGQQNVKGKGNGKAKGRGKGNGKAKGHGKGHGNASASNGHSSESSTAPAASPSYGSGGSGGSGGSNGSSGHHGSSGGHSSRGGSRGHGGGSTVSHGNGNANGHGK